MKCLPHSLKISIYFFICEPKLRHTFPNKQFNINGFKIFRCDRNRYTVGLSYVHEDIPFKPFKIPLFDLPNIEIIGLEFHQIKQKWLFIGTYKPFVVNDLNVLNLSKFTIIYLANMKTYL